MAAFKAGKKDILIATDVAARGIDVLDVTHVINHTIPEDDKAYLHRVGRTGRAGKTGIAVTFVDWDDLHKWALINRALEFGQPEPTETYSSSPHLFTDLDIPAGSTGRLRATPTVNPDGTPRERPGSRGSDGGRDSGRSGGRDGGRGGDRSGGRGGDRTSDRGGDRSSDRGGERTRTRTISTGSTPAEATSAIGSEQPNTAGGHDAPHADGQTRPRSRNRRRRSGGDRPTATA
jgi:superfamily II DNA/RNA helicase